ncbi:hypothetical protein LC724_35755 [Blautia sp. RD014234]|nr:hypothetical protein [Blautia parvula]
MPVNGKKMAVSGLLMALSVVMIVLSGILDFNTLFFWRQPPSVWVSL